MLAGIDTPEAGAPDALPPVPCPPGSGWSGILCFSTCRRKNRSHLHSALRRDGLLTVPLLALEMSCPWGLNPGHASWPEGLGVAL